MIYFDNAATSMPKSRAVADAMASALKKCGNSGRGGHAFSLNSAETVFCCRKRLAKLFNTRPENVILTAGATESLNIAIKGTNRIGGVTVVSSMEHNSVMRPINALRRNGETVMRQFLVDINSDALTLENFSAVSSSATSVVVTHASNICGRILPVQQLRELSEDAVFILDAAQTAGHIPIDIVELGVDIICIPAHKGFCGPFGVGALIVNPYSDIIIDPLLEGGTGTNSKTLEMPELLPERLEAGTANICGIAGFSAALSEFEYPENESSLFAYLLEKMRSCVDITLHGAPRGDDVSQYVPVLLFNKKGYDSEQLCSLLCERGFALRAGFHCAPNAHLTLGTYETGGVRISLGRNNTKKEIDRFISVLKGIK
ncbi:MAG: aminotransferase class V-fold PLP-dependent enzyme [Clostridia bacterium]|nr:aminotransferase class V-fold PLP-dependent enzyme [Clostridia bacterium]